MKCSAESSDSAIITELKVLKCETPIIAFYTLRVHNTHHQLLIDQHNNSQFTGGSKGDQVMPPVKGLASPNLPK